jgi:energy-coupling factor transporter transmembrane protein EcfT
VDPVARALRALGVPRIFILIIGMAYRYIFLLLVSVTDMYQARQARTPGTSTLFPLRRGSPILSLAVPTASSPVRSHHR